MREVVEWQGETYSIGHDFIWTDNIVCDMTEAAFIRIELAGTNDSYVALAETKEHLAKKITMTFGGFNNYKSRPSWVDKDYPHHFPSDENSEYSYHGKIHDGIDHPVWLEIDWNL